MEEESKPLITGIWKCSFCHRDSAVSDVCGKLHVEYEELEGQNPPIVAHQKCMEFSANLSRYKFDSFGGFFPDDVKEEIKRGRRLKCDICKKKKNNKDGLPTTGATAGCSLKKCSKTFHYYCASKSKTAITKTIPLIRKFSSTDKGEKGVVYRVFCSADHEKEFKTDQTVPVFDSSQEEIIYFDDDYQSQSVSGNIQGAEILSTSEDEDHQNTDDIEDSSDSSSVLSPLPLVSFLTNENSLSFVSKTHEKHQGNILQHASGEKHQPDSTVVDCSSQSSSDGTDTNQTPSTSGTRKLQKSSQSSQSSSDGTDTKQVHRQGSASSSDTNQGDEKTVTTSAGSQSAKDRIQLKRKSFYRHDKTQHSLTVADTELIKKNKKDDTTNQIPDLQENKQACSSYRITNLEISEQPLSQGSTSSTNLSQSDVPADIKTTDLTTEVYGLVLTQDLNIREPIRSELVQKIWLELNIPESKLAFWLEVFEYDTIKKEMMPFLMNDIVQMLCNECFTETVHILTNKDGVNRKISEYSYLLNLLKTMDGSLISALEDNVFKNIRDRLAETCSNLGSSYGSLLTVCNMNALVLFICNKSKPNINNESDPRHLIYDLLKETLDRFFICSSTTVFNPLQRKPSELQLEDEKAKIKKFIIEEFQSDFLLNVRPIDNLIETDNSTSIVKQLAEELVQISKHNKNTANQVLCILPLESYLASNYCKKLFSQFAWQKHMGGNNKIIAVVNLDHTVLQTVNDIIEQNVSGEQGMKILLVDNPDRRPVSCAIVTNIPYE